MAMLNPIWTGVLRKRMRVGPFYGHGCRAKCFAVRTVAALFARSTVRRLVRRRLNRAPGDVGYLTNCPPFGGFPLANFVTLLRKNKVYTGPVRDARKARQSSQSRTVAKIAEMGGNAFYGKHPAVIGRPLVVVLVIVLPRPRCHVAARLRHIARARLRRQRQQHTRKTYQRCRHHRSLRLLHLIKTEHTGGVAGAAIPACAERQDCHIDSQQDRPTSRS